mmetsp:Transcript_41702/g.54929  ORF Transcript_41702/g.54929 Transcript_41702/m.54929 type:complete len:85 (-) Transcript_41702:56-310(-)
MFEIATTIAARGAGQAQLYNKNEQAYLTIKIQRDGSKTSAFSQVMGQDDEEESVIDDIFNNHGKLPHDTFIEQFSTRKTANWVF